MRKNFTFIATAFIALSANAQVERFDAVTFDTETQTGIFNDVFASVIDESYNATNAVNGQSRVYFGTPNLSVEAVANAKPAPNPNDVFDGKGDQIDADGNVLVWGNVQWNCEVNKDINFAAVKGTGNPHVGITATPVSSDYPDAYKAVYNYYQPDGSAGMPQSGAYYRLTPKVNGTVKMNIFIMKGNRKLFIIDEATTMALDTTKYSAEGYVKGMKDADGNPAFVKFHHGKEPVKNEAGDTVDWNPTYVICYTTYDGDGNVKKADCADQHIYCDLTFDIEAGKTYMVMMQNTQIGLMYYEFTPSGAPAGLKGDANEDGIVDVSDITAIASYILGSNPSPFSTTNADIDGDGQISVADITGTASIILGK